jgi:hypothetical protein
LLNYLDYEGGRGGVTPHSLHFELLVLFRHIREKGDEQKEREREWQREVMAVSEEGKRAGRRWLVLSVI